MSSDPSSWKEWKPDKPRDHRIWEYKRGYKVNDVGRHESSEQFRAFQFYLNSGGNRSVPATANLAEVAENTIYNWMNKYNWEKRAAAWDKQQLTMTFKEANKTERSKHRKAIQEFRQANEDQAKLMMDVSEDLMKIIQKRILKAEAEGEDIPMGLVSGLMRAAANISESGRQAWATSLGVTELMQVVDQELEEVQVEVLDGDYDEALDIPVEE